jgi:glycosyltransferase involved in cell wall biosynthesis
MACGTPVVSSNAGSLPEVVGEAGLLVPPMDEEAMGDALLRLVTDTTLRRSLRSKGFTRAARFSWPESARLALKIFSDVGGAR